MQRGLNGPWKAGAANPLSRPALTLRKSPGVRTNASSLCSGQRFKCSRRMPGEIHMLPDKLCCCLSKKSWKRNSTSVHNVRGSFLWSKGETWRGESVGDKHLALGNEAQINSVFGLVMTVAIGYTSNKVQKQEYNSFGRYSLQEQSRSRILHNIWRSM